MKRSPSVAVILLAMVLAAGLDSHAYAQSTTPTLLPSALVPASGTFWSLQNLDSQAPLPFNPFPDLAIYSLGDGVFLVDDSSVDYSALQSQDAAAMNLQSNSLQSSIPGVGTGCGLSLGLSLSNDFAVVMLNNTRQGQTYSIWSTEDLASGNWTLETNVLGNAGAITHVLIPMNQRTNLFFRTSEYRNYVTNTIFLGLNQTNTLAPISDTMGAVGPNYFVELLNGLGSRPAIAVYGKSGALISEMGMSNFFAVSVGGTNYPTGDMSDPRILFDYQSQRWVASALQQPIGVVILAVSDDDSPTNLASGWQKYLIPVGRGSGGPDYDTLGWDGNGIYLSVLQLNGTNAGHTIVAVKKPEIYSGTNLWTRIELTNDLTSWTIQPAVNFDEVPTNGYAWFVAKGTPDSGTNYQGGAVLYRRLQWQGTNAVWADANWVEAGDAGSDYQDYYEFSGTNFSSFPFTGISAPQAGTTNGINLYSVGSRLMMATIHNGFLWTCQTVGLSGTNGAYTGDASGTNVDRSAIQWLAFAISSENTTLALAAHGRVYDSAVSNAWWYYFPSLAVNCPGDMVMGLSGSSATNYIGAFYSWRLANGSMLNQPQPFQAGTTNADPLVVARWGDYSATTLDPTDDWSFWTVQEYATPLPGRLGNVTGRWGTAISKISPSP
jgi:hypothetical protein